MKEFGVQLRCRLKEGVLDPEAEAIHQVLERMGHTQVSEFHREKIFRMKVSAESSAQAVERVRKMAREILVNLVMEDFDVEIEE